MSGTQMPSAHVGAGRDYDLTPAAAASILRRHWTSKPLV